MYNWRHMCVIKSCSKLERQRGERERTDLQKHESRHQTCRNPFNDEDDFWLACTTPLVRDGIAVRLSSPAWTATQLHYYDNNKTTHTRNSLIRIHTPIGRCHSSALYIILCVLSRPEHLVVCRSGASRASWSPKLSQVFVYIQIYVSLVCHTHKNGFLLQEDSS